MTNKSVKTTGSYLAYRQLWLPECLLLLTLVILVFAFFHDPTLDLWAARHFYLPDLAAQANNC